MTEIDVLPPAPHWNLVGSGAESPPLPPAAPVQVRFARDRKSFFRLLVRGALLELVTVGFYRFWLVTDMRRHLWSHTVVDGDVVEYTGRGKELLIGFLVAIAILVPVYVGYFILGLEAERQKTFASSSLVLFFYLFGQFAIYRARRYRLTRTVWRGVRFWMTGSGWVYALRSMLWGMLTWVTAGLALPWRTAALERYKMQHSHYGNLQGSFEGTGWGFFKQGWWLWLAGVIACASALLGPVAFFVLLLAPFAYAIFKAIEWRWWLSGVRFGDVRVESTLKDAALVGLYWKFIGCVLLLLIAFVAYFALCGFLVASMKGIPIGQIAQEFSRHRAAFMTVPIYVLLGVSYVVALLSLNVLIRVFLLHDLWARVVNSVTIHGIEAAAAVTAQGELASALGEGFADGLDVGGF